MRRTVMIWEVFVTRFEEALACYRRRRLATANRFIAEVYLPAHNARFAVPPEQGDSPEGAHRPAGLAVGPDGALCVSDDKSGRVWRIISADTGQM